MEGIQSILEQTYRDFEIILVDDASPNPNPSLLQRLDDPSIVYIRKENNEGAVAARKTGVHASSGEIIAFLDQDDLFHREKLQTHLTFLQNNPNIGATYNARFEIKDSSRTIVGLWQPPKQIVLDDCVLGFPASPSDVVLRRKWALRDEIWDDSFAKKAEHVIFNGQEIVFFGRLALNGCQFGNVGRALNYRRFHSQRKQKYLELRCESELACQDLIFNDPRCPPEILGIRNIAAANFYLVWAYAAYTQEEFEIGKSFLTKAVERKPSLLLGEPNEFLNTWANWLATSASEFGNNLENAINIVLSNLPEKIVGLRDQYSKVVARSYLYRGIHSLIWGDLAEARKNIEKAEQIGVVVDDSFSKFIVGELAQYEAEFGSASSRKIMRDILQVLREHGDRRNEKFLGGHYWINSAIVQYQNGETINVPAEVMKGINYYPGYLLNRGVISILFHSIFKNASGPNRNQSPRKGWKYDKDSV